MKSSFRAYKYVINRDFRKSILHAYTLSSVFYFIKLYNVSFLSSLFIRGLKLFSLSESINKIQINSESRPSGDLVIVAVTFGLVLLRVVVRILTEVVHGFPLFLEISPWVMFANYYVLTIHLPNVFDVMSRADDLASFNDLKLNRLFFDTLF